MRKITLLVLYILFIVFMLSSSAESQENTAGFALPSIPATHTWLIMPSIETIPPYARWFNNTDMWEVKTYLDRNYGLIKELNPHSSVTRTVEMISEVEGVEYIKLNDVLTFIIHVYTDPVGASLDSQPRAFSITSYKIIVK